MPTDPSTPRPEPGPEASVDDLQADIDATRAELGETVQAVSAKADISGRAKQKAADTQAAVADKVTHAKVTHAKDTVAESGRQGNWRDPRCCRRRCSWLAPGGP
jgi:hypothetical protein